MPTRVADRLPRLDALRGVAALLVVADHLVMAWCDKRGLARPDIVYGLGTLGVAIFFVLSGLVITRTLIASLGAGLHAYALRRLARIVPAYWVALTACVLLLPGQAPVDGVEGFARAAAFGQVYARDTYFSGIGPAWTLCIELTFYALAPLVVAVAARSGRPTRVAAVLGTASLTLVAIWPDGAAARTLPGFLGWFALGIALAYAVDAPSAPLRRFQRRVATWPGLIGLATAYVAYAAAASTADLWPAGSATTMLVFGVLGFLAVAAAADPVAAGGATGRWLGERSYGIYLWHHPIVGTVVVLTGSLAVYVVVVLGATLLLAAASYRYVERPAMNAARRATLRRSAGPVSVPPGYRLTVAARPTE